MHYELADFLKAESNSEDIDMWGFNLWLEETEPEDVIEYDSLINIHNNQMHGYMRAGMNIMDKDIEDKATEVILKWIQL